MGFLLKIKEINMLGWHGGCHNRGTMTMSMKQKMQALLYYMLIILAVYITGCRNTPGVGEPIEEPNPTSTNQNTDPTEEEPGCPVAESISAIVQSSTSVTLSWNWSENDYSAFDNYLIQRKLTSASAWVELASVEVDGTPAEAFTDSDAIPGEIHYRVVSDCDATMYHSTPSNSVTALAALEIPAISTVQDMGTYHRVNFAYATDGLSGHNGFQIEYVVNSNAAMYATQLFNISATYQNVTPSGCSTGQLVTYRIRATRANLLQSSDWSAPFQTICP